MGRGNCATACGIIPASRSSQPQSFVPLSTAAYERSFRATRTTLPSSARARLSADNRHWFRAKFHERYRLFYRFSSKEKVIVYAWVNAERTLRKSGSKTDPYNVFRAMLEVVDPPSSIDILLRRANELKA